MDVSILPLAYSGLTQPDYQTSLTTVTQDNGSGDYDAIVHVEVNNGATAEVTAQIIGNNTPRGRYTVTYFWGDPNYDDGGSRRPPTQPPPATTQPQIPTLTIIPTGEGTTRQVTVTATDAQGTAVSGLAITLTSLTSGFTLSDAERNAVSGTAKTITVPTNTPAVIRFKRVPLGIL